MLSANVTALTKSVNRRSGRKIFRSRVPQRGSVTELEFTTSEFTAFRLAAADGEFSEHAFTAAA